MSTWIGQVACVAAALLLPACAQKATSDGSDHGGHEHVGEVGSAVFTNGDFESGTNNQPPPSWTVSTYLNPGVTIQTPQTRAGLNLGTGGTARTYTLVAAGGPESQADPTLTTAASLRWPKFGNSCAIVNQQGSTRNVNGMTQTMTLSSADIDPIDGLAHVRLVLAPVLQDPGHAADQQPYFFIQLTNITKGNAVVYNDFNFANQSGVPWKQNAAGNVKYTDWALVDIAPGAAQMGIGDQVQLEIIGAGCSLGAHWGQVYVDGVGTTVPGVFVSGTGPSVANQNTDITYTLTYKNGGANNAGGVVVEFNTPPNTTFTSFSAPGLTCTAPAMGATGLVSCTVGALPAGGSGSFTVTVHINNGTAGSVITAGNYDIYGTGISPLIGPKVYTTVTNNVTYADLSISKTDGVSSVAAGSLVTYTITVDNAGPNAVTGATVNDPLPAQLLTAAWTCAGTGGATCTPAGTGSISDSATSIPVGGKLTYTLTATVDPNAAAGIFSNGATVTVPGTAVDPATVNNSAADYDQIIVANGVACTTNADCISNVCDPADNKCGFANGDGPCSTTNGGTVCRSGVCSPNGNVCMPAGGCAVDADCAAAEWCNTESFTCTPKLPNSTPVPTVSGHNPPLTGACTVAAGAAVCSSAVCDANDNACGYANGDGPCTMADATTVCRSGACSANAGVCIPVGGCFLDSDCGATEWCNTSVFTCTPKLPNGAAVPTVGGHDPALTGVCAVDVAIAVCQSAVCDAGDNACGYANGDGPCTMADAATVCRSGACSANGTCMPSGGCNVDADCTAAQWCNISQHACAPKIGNGGVMPNDPGHAVPVIDGTCNPPAANVVCVSQVCDDVDSRCGYANGDGTCDATNGSTVCRSAVCDTKDSKCGFLNGDGPCTLATGPVVCRSGACSPNGDVCMPVGGCAVDADCGASEWCNTESFSCQPKLPNGQDIPTVAGHTPALTGTCSAASGKSVCESGVCDATDNKCGYANGDGPCTAQNGGVVCRSSTCGTTGVCEEPVACTTDADCNAATQYCDTGAKLCAPKLPNGSPLPVVTGHTPEIDGVCDPAEAAVVCQSGVCDATDNKCGYANGDGPCTITDAGTVCRSSTCSENGAVCVPSGGCAVDKDCAATQWCNTQLFACVPKLPNGQGIPTVSGHTPALTGTCTPETGDAVCQSGVCDTNDNKCGYANGDGPCSAADAGTVCREGACDIVNAVCESPIDCLVDADCDTTYQYCDTGAGKCAPKLPNGALLPGVPGHTPVLDGTCSPTSAQIVCQSGVCDPEDDKCGHAIGKGPCDAANGETVCRSTICAVSGPSNGLCVECVADAQCAGAKPVCDTTTNFCVQCTTAEDEACAGSTPVCVAGPDTCAPCDGDLGSGADRACTDSTAPFCFLTGSSEGQCGKCTSDADCVGHPGGETCDTQSGACTTSGCTSDAQCGADEWCNAPVGATGSCVPKLDNGVALPDMPSSVSTCTTTVGARVCKSGVCDTADDKCGYANGDGPCDDGAVCRSGACDAKDKLCGLADGDGPCSTDDVCRGGTCDTVRQVCGNPGCKTDDDCTSGEFCGSDGACTPKRPDGQACSGNNQCQSGACYDGTCDAILASGNGLVCAAATPGETSDSGSSAALVGLALAIAGLSRRRRR